MFYCGPMKVEKLKKCNLSNAGIALRHQNSVLHLALAALPLARDWLVKLWCWAQSVDLRYPWICLRNLWIHSLRRNLWMFAQSMDRAGFNLPIYRFFIPTLPQSHFYELILLDKLQYVIGELFSKYQPGTKRTCLIIVILRQLNAVTLFSTLLRRRQSVILFRRL